MLSRIFTAILVSVVVTSSVILILPGSWLPFLSLDTLHRAPSLAQRGATVATTPLEIVPISLRTREYWMREAVTALHGLVSPCPFAAFGTVIVNHTSPDDLGDPICIGANAMSSTGNPTLHGEIAAINNCTAVLTDPKGIYKLSPAEVIAAWKDLTLYTTAEPCPMCATAIRWAGFRECVFGTSIETLIRMGWGQIDLPSSEIFERSDALGTKTRLLQDVLAKETDPYFAWQFDGAATCPVDCERDSGAGTCVPTADNEVDL
ncbi:hypothetical protein LTR08_005273 [Meristemomyces frigidus]|nr:hypothetical protein LTR08_005273 [Meristemomyces frigidus]